MYDDNPPSKPLNSEIEDGLEFRRELDDLMIRQLNRIQIKQDGTEINRRLVCRMTHQLFEAYQDATFKIRSAQRDAREGRMKHGSEY